MIAKLNNESVSISGISRITGMSKSNVIKKLDQMASEMERPIIQEDQQEYEIDEMHTFIGKKTNHCYIQDVSPAFTKNEVRGMTMNIQGEGGRNASFVSGINDDSYTLNL
jgi:hypothetical protein